jgi:hypothetical protein
MTEAAGSTPEPAAVSALRFPEGFAFVGSGFLLVLELVAGRLPAPTIGGSILGADAVSSSGCGPALDAREPRRGLRRAASSPLWQPCGHPHQVRARARQLP